MSLTNNALAESYCRFDSLFEKLQGCFLLYDINQSEYLIQYGGHNCNQRITPASTFKIANALIGLELGVLQDEKTTYQWDKSKKMLKIWERNHSLQSAMKYSVVWYFQKIATFVGDDNYKEFLKLFEYGNQDISGGLTKFWLANSLKISPKEQLNFLNKIYKNDIPVSKKSLQILKDILMLKSDENMKLSGKTGAASVGGVNIGWFIGNVKTKNQEYNFVTQISKPGTDYKINGQYAGGVAQKITKEILLCL